MPGLPLISGGRPVMRYAVTGARDRERQLGLRGRASLTPSPKQQTVLATAGLIRGAALRRPHATRPLGVVARRRSAMRWTGTPAVRVERRTGAAATPWRG